jgi:hypothetical protein
MWLFRQPFDAQQDAVKDGWSIAEWVVIPQLSVASKHCRQIHPDCADRQGRGA